MAFSAEEANQFKVRLSSVLRLILVDAETATRLLGCVICGPSYVVSQGDLPRAVVRGLGLTDVSSSQLSILSMTPNEVTLGLKSDERTEAVFTSEASVVFIQRQVDDPSGSSMEGLVLLRDNGPAFNPRTSLENSTSTSSTEQEEEEVFRCVYARSDEKGIYWHKSRSEYLVTGLVQGGFLFDDIVAIRQCPRMFEFSTPDLADMFNSTIEFVLRSGPPVVFALSFPFPLVQWLYCVHAALRLPRMSLSVSDTGTWNCVLEDGFSLGSPLIVECLKVTVLSPKLGISLAKGCGGTIVDSRISPAESNGEVRRSTKRLDDRRHASQYLVNRHRNASLHQNQPSPTQIHLVNFGSQQQSIVRTTLPVTTAATAVANVLRGEALNRDFAISSSRTLSRMGGARDGLPSHDHSQTSLMSIVARPQFEFASSQPSFESIALRPEALATVATKQHLSGSVTSHVENVQPDQKSSSSKPSLSVFEKEDCEVEPGDLILKVGLHWTMDDDWRETERLLLSLGKQRPLELLVGRCESLAHLATAPDVILKAKQVQLLLSSWALFAVLHDSSAGPAPRAVRSVKSPLTTSTASKHVSASPAHLAILELDSKEARRRAATRQLFRRQTSKIDPSTIVESSERAMAKKERRNGPELDANGPIPEYLSPNVGRAQQRLQAASPPTIPIVTSAAILPTSAIAPANHEDEDMATKDASSKAASSSFFPAVERVGWTALKSVANVWSLPGALAKSKSASATRPSDGTSDTDATRGMSCTQPRQASSSAALIPVLDQLLKAPETAKREAASNLLLNLTNDKLNKATAGPICIPALIQACGDSSPVVQEECAGALWNLSDHPENALLIARQGGVQALTRLLGSSNEFAVEEACGALWTLAEDETNVPLLILSGALQPLIQLLSKHDQSAFLEENASGCLWTLSSSPSARKLLNEDARLILTLLRLLKESTYVTRENVLGLLANIFADDAESEMRSKFLQSKGAQKLVQAVMFGRSEPVKRNAATCLTELARNNADMALMLASEGAITALLKLLLQAQEGSTKICAAEGLRVLAEVPENAVQLSELGSVPEVLRMLEQARKTKEERQPLEAQKRELRVRASVAMNDAVHPEDMLAHKRYVHFDSAVLDAGLDKMVSTMGSQRFKQEVQETGTVPASLMDGENDLEETTIDMGNLEM